MPMPEENLPEQKDWTKVVWAAVLLLVILMVAGIWLGGRSESHTTSVHVRHILVGCNTSDAVDRNRALERINEIRDRIGKGESFAALARQYSDDTQSARRGGDLGWASRGVYDKAFDEYCWTGEIGKVSDVISTSFGFHLILIEERRISDAEQYEAGLDIKAREEEKARRK